MRIPATIATLNRLIRTCRDAGRVCSAWGPTAGSAHLRTRFRLRSEEWDRHGDELQALVLLLGGEPATSATMLTRARCVWVACSYTVMGNNDAAALDGCESAQQLALRCYEQAWSGYLPERIRRTVSLQARQISVRCDRLTTPAAHFAAP